MSRKQVRTLPILLALGLASGQPATAISEQSSAPAAGPAQPAFVPIATGKQRICREKQTVEISQGSQRVSVDYFTELVIATINDERIVPEKLIGETISLARDAKQKERWIIFRGGASDGDTLAMPENVFRIEKVLLSTRERQVKMKVGDQDYHLERGEVVSAWLSQDLSGRQPRVAGYAGPSVQLRFPREATRGSASSLALWCKG